MEGYYLPKHISQLSYFYSREVVTFKNSCIFARATIVKQ